MDSEPPTYIEPSTPSITHRNAVPVDAIVRVPPPDLAALVARASTYAKTSRAPNTVLAYAADLRTFKTWADERLLPDLPTSEEVVVCYVAWMADAGRKVSTIQRALSAIFGVHKALGHAVPKGPRLEETLEGIRRQVGVAPTQKAPVLADDLRKMIDKITGDSLIDARDRLMLVLGWTGAFRRSEIVALHVGDVVKVRGGLEVSLRRSKTDQTGAGRTVAIPRASDETYDATALLAAWLSASGLTEGPLFRAVNRHGYFSTDGLVPRAVARVVKARAEAAGLNPDIFSGHSLRAGLVTEAAESGKTDISIRRITGHSSSATLQRYIRSSDIWRDCASKGLL